MTLWNRRDGKGIRGCQMLERRDEQADAEGFQGSETAPDDMIAADARHYAFLQTTERTPPSANPHVDCGLRAITMCPCRAVISKTRATRVGVGGANDVGNLCTFHAHLLWTRNHFKASSTLKNARRE